MLPVNDGGHSPSTDYDGGEIAFQANTGSLWEFDPGCCGRDLGLGMKAGTSPSSDDAGDVAFQGSDGHLWVTGPGGTFDLGLGMRAGTSPSLEL